MRAFWLRFGTAAPVLVPVLALVLTGCSVLSGRSSSDATMTNVPRQSASAGANGPHPAFTDSKTVRAVLSAAKQDFETIYTFDYRDIAKYRAAGLGVTTSPYSSTYGSAFQGRPAQAIANAKLVQVAKSSAAAIASLNSAGTSADVILHGSLATTSTSAPAGATKSTTVVLGLRLSGHKWRVASVRQGAAVQGSLPANAALRAAVRATRTALLRIWTLRRHYFTTDYDKAMADTVDVLRATMQQEQGSVRSTLQKGGYDLSGRIVGLGLMLPGTDVSSIVAVDEYRTAKHGAKLGPYHHFLLVITTYLHGKWRLRSATPLT